MNGLPSTQPTPDIPTIFIKTDGSSYSVFTQAEDIFGRPRIAKLLKKGGAIISKDPKDADIVLVNDATGTGKQFIKVWSNDGQKVVLRYQWVNACVAARRILTEADNWGDYMTSDDGLPLEDNFSELEPNPLPTPRQSPVGQPGVPPAASQAKPSSSIPKSPTKSGSSKAIDEVPTASPEMASNGDAYLSDVINPQPPSQHMRLARNSPAKMEETRVSDKVKGKGRDTSDEPERSASEQAAPPRIFASSKFFVQVGFPKRQELVTNIKKNGGLIEANLGDADYAILHANGVTNPRDYQHLLNSAISSGMPALNTQFITDCILHGTMLDPQEYAFSPPGKNHRSAKRKSFSAWSGSDDEEPALKKKKPSKSSVKGKQAKHESSKTKVPKTTEAEPPSSESSADIQRNKYTQAELEFALEEASYLYTNDEHATEMQLAINLHSKMPQHTRASWSTFISRVKRNEFQDARKRGAIQCRKRKDEEERAQRMRQPSAYDRNGDNDPFPPPQPLEIQPNANDYSYMDRFASFLAFEGGDSFPTNDPNAVFRELAIRDPRLPYNGWKDIWCAFNIQITDLYEQRRPLDPNEV